MTELLKILFQAMWMTFSGIISGVMECLPELLEVKDIFSALTPTRTEIVAAGFGVPAFLVSAIIFLFKLSKRRNRI